MLRFYLITMIVIFVAGCGGGAKNSTKSNANPLVDEGKWTLLHKLVAGNQIVEVSEMLKKHDINVNVKAEGPELYKTTPLHLACANGELVLVDLLLEHGAEVNAKTSTGATPLHKAIEARHLQTVKALVEHGANVNVFSFYVHSPLKMARNKGYKEIEAFLLSRGAKEN